MSQNNTLINVWKTTVDGVSCYSDNWLDAIDCAGDNGIVVLEQMQKDKFENLVDFKGF